MSPVASKMEQRTQKHEQERQDTEEMGTMLREQEERGDRCEADERDHLGLAGMA